MEQPDDAHVIQAQGLVRHFGRGSRRVTAVDGLDVEVGAGRCLGLLGRNGSGKSTTLRMILGALEPDAGRLEVLGGRAGRRAARLRTGYVPEEARRIGRLDGLGTVDLFARLQQVGPRAERRRRVEEALQAVGLPREAWRRAVSGYSRGMTRRLAIAAAWVHRPALLVLDEPTSGLDPPGAEEIHALLRTHVEGGGAIVISTHDRVATEALCDECLVLHGGRARLSGPPADLLADDQGPSLSGLLERAAHA